MLSRRYKHSLDIFKAAISAVNPYVCTQQIFSINQNHDLYEIKVKNSTYKFDNIILVGAGKASIPMAEGIEHKICQKYPNIPLNGVIITKYDHSINHKLSKNIEIYEAGHPIADINGYNATKKLLHLLDTKVNDKSLVIVLISGGGSALLVHPITNKITIKDLQGLNHLLLRSGATINEINIIRKELSLVKGGKLAEYICNQSCHDNMFTLIMSDVIGDPLDIIASGPTVISTTNINDCMNIISKYKIWDQLSDNIKQYLNEKVLNKQQEYISLYNPQSFMIANNTIALNAAKDYAINVLHFDTKIITYTLEGEAKDVAKLIAKQAINTLKDVNQATCILYGGETTVTLNNSTGLGGRNQELAMIAATYIT